MGGAKVKIVLVTRDDLEHKYVANVLCEGLELSAIIVDRGVKRSPWERFQTKVRKYGFFGSLERALLVIFKRLVRDSSARQRELTDVFGGDKCAAFHRADLVVEVEGINRQPALDILNEMAPDLLLVYGTGIVGKRARASARKLVLNMHTGVSPFYRGSSCAFWPLHNGEPERVGATVHECVAEVDGGRIFAVSTAELAPSDGLHAVFGRAVVAGAQKYVEVVQDIMADRAQALPQDLSIGHEYKVSMRGLKAELRARYLIRKGLVRDFAQKGSRRSGASAD